MHENYDPIKIKKKFERAMAQKGWTKTTTAYRCEISPGMLSKILTGERTTVKTIGRIAKKLGVPLEQIMKDETDEEVVA
jgi:transcriptional regulator with XRE-family HTH domain